MGKKVHDSCKTHQSQLDAWWDGKHAIIQRLPVDINSPNACPVEYRKAKGETRVISMKFGAGGPTLLDACKTAEPQLASWWDGNYAYIVSMPHDLDGQDFCECMFVNKNGQRRLVSLKLQ